MTIDELLPIQIPRAQVDGVRAQVGKVVEAGPQPGVARAVWDEAFTGYVRALQEMTRRVESSTKALDDLPRVLVGAAARAALSRAMAAHEAAEDAKALVVERARAFIALAPSVAVN